jgi:hypothetical protein
VRHHAPSNRDRPPGSAYQLKTRDGSLCSLCRHVILSRIQRQGLSEEQPPPRAPLSSSRVAPLRGDRCPPAHLLLKNGARVSSPTIIDTPTWELPPQLDVRHWTRQPGVGPPPVPPTRPPLANGKAPLRRTSESLSERSEVPFSWVRDPRSWAQLLHLVQLSQETTAQECLARRLPGGG